MAELGTIITQSGTEFNVINPNINSIHEADIAHALSHMPRWGGHLPYYLSVAQHSIIVAILVEKHFNRPDLALQALLHDASEAYLMDIPSTIKPLLPEYKKLEKKVQDKIFEKYELPVIIDPIVKQADQLSLNGEYNSIMVDREISLKINELKYPITLMNFSRSRISFLNSLEIIRSNELLSNNLTLIL